MRLRRLAAILPLAAAALTVTAGAANATILPAGGNTASATATTRVSGDPDNGHGTPSEWAVDAFERTVTVTRGAPAPASACGQTSGQCWAFTASLKDNGTFTTIPGAGTPNQACAGCAGEKIRSRVTGILYGTYQITFYASASPQARLVPASHNDHGLVPSPPYTSTTWPELFFPAGTHFGAFTGGAYSWTYIAVVPRFPFHVQQWTDSSTVANNDGNAPGDGNVTG